MNIERRPASAVADPSLPAHVRRRLTCPPPPRRRPLPRPLRWLLGCSLIAVAARASISGRGLVIVLVLVLAAFLVRKAATAGPSMRVARCRRRYRGRFVDPSCIDPRGRRQLARAQQAIRAVLESPVYRDGAIDFAVTGAILAEHEWDIACLLRDAAALRTQSALMGSAPAAADPAVQGILAQHAEVLVHVGDAVDHRVQDLEAYAAEVLAADRAYTAWLLAGAAAGLNDHLLDLLAKAPGHGRKGQITRLAAEARACSEIFRGLLGDPIAAAPLALPDPPCSDAG